jgi:hypothetical protein
MSAEDIEVMEVVSNQLKHTVDKCTLMSSELEKFRLAEKEVQTLLAENQKLVDTIIRVRQPESTA